MAWVPNNLSSNEKLLVLSRPHWIWFLSPIHVLLYALTGGLWLLYRYWVRRTHELAVTNKRIVIKTGILVRHVIDIKLSSVESIEVRQSVLGRMMGFGTVLVNGNGEDVLTLKAMQDPWAFQRAAQA